MASDNGGPAFARGGCDWTQDHGDGAWAQDGMSLRDYFAAKALVGLAIQSVGPEAKEAGWDAVNNDDVAREAYRIADAMLAARKAVPQ